MHWHEAIDVVAPYVVKITTPQGSGTGWLVSRSATSELCGIATAAHVIDHAHDWDEPIRITSMVSGNSVLLRSDERAIFMDRSLDSAAVIFDEGDLGLPSEVLDLVDVTQFVKPGVEIGWLGFPALPTSGVCFFSGRVSAFLAEPPSYLVDGVAINGVSGGPAFTIADDEIEILGIVAAYIPNRATGEVLPGVAVVRDATQCHDVVKQLRTFDEAKEQEASAEESN